MYDKVQFDGRDIKNRIHIVQLVSKGFEFHRTGKNAADRYAHILSILFWALLPSERFFNVTAFQGFFNITGIIFRVSYCMSRIS